MPTGVYIRTPETLAAMKARAISADVIARLKTPDSQAKAAAARKIARPRKSGYLAVGRRVEEFRTLHRVRAEKALGKPLPDGAVIHHADGDKLNPEARLVICPDDAYHQLLHFRMRIKAAGGDPNNDRICSRCKIVKDKSNFGKNRIRKADGLSNFCRRCISEKNAIQNARRAS